MERFEGRELIMYNMKRNMQCVGVILFMIHVSHGLCPAATFKLDNGTKIASYSFVTSSSGNIGSSETCPYTGRPYVYLPCHQSSSWGNEPFISECKNPVDVGEPKKKNTLDDNSYYNFSITELFNLLMNNSYSIHRALSYLNDETTKFQTIADVTSVINILEGILADDQNRNNIQFKLYSIAAKILSLDLTVDVKENHAMKQNTVKLLSLLDEYSQRVKFDELEKSFISKNLSLLIANQLGRWTKSIIGFSFDPIKNETKSISTDVNYKNSTFITLDHQIMMKQNRCIFSIYNHKIGLFDDEKYHVLSRIVSLTVDKPNLIRTMNTSVKIHFFMDEKFYNKNISFICAYWHIHSINKKNRTAHWSTDGCSLSNVTEQSVTCMCNHLTHFAVLMDIEQKSKEKNLERKQIEDYMEQVRLMIVLLGLLISSIGLCLTILTFIIFRKLRRHFSQNYLLFLSVNLLAVNILFSIAYLFRSNHSDDLCIIIASLLHYFLLSTFNWMVIIAAVQYLLFVKVFLKPISGFTKIAIAFAQLVPLIPVIVVLAMDPLNYAKRNYSISWLSDLPFYVSFILPIALCVVVSSIIFFMVGFSLLCNSTSGKLRRTQALEPLRLSRFSIAFGCFIVLTLSWIFALLTMKSNIWLFQILFCVFTALTGLSIFILYIIISKAKRTSWNNTFKTLGISSIYSPASSTSGFLSTTDFPSTTISNHQNPTSRRSQYSAKSQHFIDAYMPSSPPPPAPPVLPPPPPPLLSEGDDSLCTTNVTTLAYEARHVWAPETNFIYESNQMATSHNDYSVFYATNHDATKL